MYKEYVATNLNKKTTLENLFSYTKALNTSIPVIIIKRKDK